MFFRIENMLVDDIITSESIFKVIPDFIDLLTVNEDTDYKRVNINHYNILINREKVLSFHKREYRDKAFKMISDYLLNLEPEIKRVLR